MSAPPPAILLDPTVLALLACPNCAARPPLTLAADALSLRCASCERRYPILDGLPDLRPDGQRAPAPAAMR
jgi:uncharacterized protein YbaR (Trm112 family)